MVRLKEISKCRCNKQIDISIPYGAIKSDQLAEMLIDFAEFQFLMVRLKDLEKKLEEILEQNFNSLWCD